MSTAKPQIPNAIAHENFVLGGAPTTDHLQEAIDEGFKAFIDLRTHGESGVDLARDALAHPDVFYLHLPIAGANGLTKENVKAFDDAIEQNDGPFLIFCGSGNRVGALMTLRAHWHQGVSPEEAVKLGRSTGLTQLEPIVRQIMGL